MTQEPDRARLKALEARLAEIGKPKPAERSAAGRAFSQGEVAWRMVIELVSGMLIGFGIGWGLDWTFGTRPIFLVIFVLLGLAAGVRVMLGTARSITSGSVGQVEAGAARAAEDGDDDG